MAYLTQFSSSIPVIKFLIDHSVMTIGQDIEMDICVPEEGIAGNHATVEAVKQSNTYRYIIKSRDEETLLDLNGNSISQAELKDGDWLIIGGVEFQFTDDGINKLEENIVHINTASNSKPHKRVKATKEDEVVKPMSTKEFIEDSRFSRRLNRF